MFVSWLIKLNAGTASEIEWDDGPWSERGEAFQALGYMLTIEPSADVELLAVTARGRQEVIFSNRGQLALSN